MHKFLLPKPNYPITLNILTILNTLITPNTLTIPITPKNHKKNNPTMNFDKNRFANFAKYDLTINKAFFRNLLLVTIAGAVGIAMMGFIARYNIYHDVASNLSEWNTVPEPGEFSHYTFNYLTASYEICFFLVMMSIFAGCWAHNLRNKQGRIIELTLPATNLEKFTWHTLLMLVGGFVLCLVSIDRKSVV